MSLKDFPDRNSHCAFFMVLWVSVGVSMSLVVQGCVLDAARYRLATAVLTVASRRRRRRMQSFPSIYDMTIRCGTVEM